MFLSNTRRPLGYCSLSLVVVLVGATCESVEAEPGDKALRPTRESVSGLPRLVSGTHCLKAARPSEERVATSVKRAITGYLGTYPRAAASAGSLMSRKTKCPCISST